MMMLQKPKGLLSSLRAKPKTNRGIRLTPASANLGRLAKREISSLTPFGYVPPRWSSSLKANFASEAKKGSPQKSVGDLQLTSRLILAASTNDLPLVKEMIEKLKLDPNSCDYDKRTALHLASSEGNLEICQYLVSKGANVNAMDRMGGTPLMDALRHKHQHVVQFLRQGGGKIYTNKDEMSAMLCRAASEGNLQEVRHLLDVGAEVNHGDYDNRAPLHLAVAGGHIEVVEQLLKLGANVNITDRFGRTPLSEVATSPANQQELEELLKKYGAISDEQVLSLVHKNDFSSALRRSLPILCQNGKWAYCEAWVPSQHSRSLEITDIWYSDTTSVARFAPLRIASENQTYQLNEGIVGKVWESKQPTWITQKDFHGVKADVSVLNNIGVQSGLCVPVLYNNTVTALLLFFDVSAKPEDSVLSQELFRLANYLISSGLVTNAQVETNQYGVFQEQRNLVKNMIVEEGVFTSDLIIDEVDWFYSKLGFPSFYFEHFPPHAIAQHLHSLIAAKKVAQIAGDKENISITLEQANQGFYICPGKKEAQAKVERKIEAQMLKVHDENRKNPQQTKIYSLTVLRSKHQVVEGGSEHLQMNIFNIQQPTVPTCGEEETDLWKVSSGEFMRDKSLLVKQRYKAILEKAHHSIAPVMEVFPIYKDGTIPIMIAYRDNSSVGYLSTVTELLDYHKIAADRKFVQSFSNGMVVLSFYLQTPVTEKNIRAFLESVGLMMIVPSTPLSSLFLNEIFTSAELMYSIAGLNFAYYFLNQPYAEEVQSLQTALREDPLNKGRLANLQQRLQRDSVTEARISECITQYPDIVKEIYEDFEKSFSPDLPRDKKVNTVNQHIAHNIKKKVQNVLDGQILNTLLVFNASMLKTNFFKDAKSSVSFRLNPFFLKDVSSFPEVPFAIFLVVGAEFRGFHVRFRDIARGGIRVIHSSNPQQFNKNLETLFQENYNLAYTQQKKNKDIPEFGSKGTILLSPNHQNSALIAFRKYVDGLLDLLLPNEEIVDHYAQTELLFLGPDEGTAEMMDWAALYARARGYRFWKSFTTGKSVAIGGIPHDKYGMTTRSIHRYVLGSLEKKGLAEENVTKLQTGGPDGDLGSNEVLISKDKTIGIADGSGVLYDPAGIDRTALTVLAKKRQMVKYFDKSKLGPGGFLVLIGDRDVTLPSGETVESGLTFRNEFHLHPLSTADMFVPCGGRPESVNVKNVNLLLNKDGTPRFKFIIEGANLFLTQDARLVLESAGVILFKDASANKGGVTSSSLEVLAALALDDAEFEVHMQIKGNQIPAFYEKYVVEVQQTIERNANMEFHCLWNEKERTSHPYAILTDLISDKINELNTQIQSSALWDDEQLRRKILSQAIPPSLVELLGLDKIISRVPPNYTRAIFGAYLASHYIYTCGITVSEFKFFEFMNQFTNTATTNDENDITKH